MTGWRDRPLGRFRLTEVPCGDGHAQVDVSLATLLGSGFRGWMMIDAWEIPGPYDACTKGKRAIDRALGKTGKP